MDANRKRRAVRVLGGGDEPPDDPARMTDAELLAAWTTDPHAPPEPRPSGSPMARWLRGLSDAQLTAEHDAAQAELAAAEAELERRRPKPKPAPAPVVVAEPAVEPHEVALQEPTPPKPRVQLTPRQAFDAKQAQMMQDAVAEAQADGALEAEQRRRDDARPSDYAGPMLGELLRGG